MVDKYTKTQRSAIMSKVKNKNTSPEILIRKALFLRGFRYRIHYKKLPGSPDIVLPKYKAVIFVHGCFWHGHNCKAGKVPKTNIKFWREKLSRNKERDKSIIKKIEDLGWKTLVVWECSLKGKKDDIINHVVEEIARWIEK